MSGTSRQVIEEYAKRDPNSQKYLKVYDAIQGCAKDPKGCASNYAKDKLAQTLAEETGLPAVDIRACLDNPQQCAKDQALNYLAAETGISPEVIRLAAECAQSNDTDACAKAGLILAANAACTYYTAGAGAVSGLCSKVAPILVEFAWPFVKPLITFATFGVGLDGLINVVTFGQGLGFVLAPIGGAIKLLGGEDRGKFHDLDKRSVFNQAILMTNDAVNGAVKGLWEAQLAVRETSGLGHPKGDANQVAWATERFQRWHQMRNNKMGVVAGLKAAQKALQEDDARPRGWGAGAPPRDRTRLFTIQYDILKAEHDRDFWLRSLAPPWGVPTHATPETAAREHFYASFMDKLAEFGFNEPAWRSSKKGKKVKLNGGNWFAYGWEKVCSNCTENDVEVFADMVLKLFAERRIARIEPAIVATVDKIVRDTSEATAAAAPLRKLTTKLPISLLAKIAKKPLLIPSNVLAVMRERKSKPIVIRRPNFLKEQSDANPAMRAWAWSKANPEYAIPAASIGLVLVVLVADRVVS